MLDGAYSSPKIRRLAAVLGVPWPHALGLAGLLWRFAAKHAPTGEVGRHDDEDLATALEWPDDAERLVAAFVRCRLLDPVDGPARLVVHDWPDHAPRYVLATLRRRGLDWSDAYAKETADETTDETADGTADGTTSTSSSSSSSASTHSSSSSSEGVFGPIARVGPEDRSSRRSGSGRPSRRPAASDAGDGDDGATAGSDEDPAEAIWAAWVPGRKTGKARGLAAIRASVDRLVADGYEAADAFARIETATRRDAGVYAAAIEEGRLAARFVPYAVTYFTQERWADDPGQQETDNVEQQIRRMQASR